MKKNLISLLAFCLMGVGSAFAQSEIVVGDMNQDGQLTVGDVAALSETIIGKMPRCIIDPNASDPSAVAGEWRAASGTSITLTADGAASYSTDATVKNFEYYSFRGDIVLLNEGGFAVKCLHVARLSNDYIVLSNADGSCTAYYSGDHCANSFVMSATSLSLKTGETQQLSIIATPEGCISPIFEWTSSNTAVATVDQNGLVTAIKGGTCTITATTNDVSGIKAECMVTVKEGKSEPLSFTANGVTFKMIFVEHGTFQMGSYSSRADYDERPVHTVTISKDYYIGETEVTQALWEAVTGYTPMNDWSSSRGLGDNYPTYFLSWDDYQDFITKLNQLTGQIFRMPTEAEWEFAARGGNKSKGYEYSGSDNISNVAWYFGNSGHKTHPVATMAPNELGIYDMTGNVKELCSDWYGSYSSAAVTDPTGPSSGSFRVSRGGDCDEIDSRVGSVSRRHYMQPSGRGLYNGLRLAL